MLRTRAPSLVIRGRQYLQEAADVIGVSPDEIEELLGYLFPAAKEAEIEPLRRDSLYSSVPRGRSALLTVSIDHRVEKLLKIAPSHKVKREMENYEQFVHDRLKGIRHAVLTQHEALWNIGGLVYSLIGTGKELPPTFSKYYESHQGATDNENQDPQRKVQIEHVLSELFDSWSFHYAGHFVAPKLTDEPLFAQYNEVWSRKLEEKLKDLHNAPPVLPTAFGFLPHPVEWVARHHMQSNTKGMRKAITHGDLHGENILVDWDGHCWLLDFERTGIGPILQDFTELETDIITRLTHASHEEFFRLCLLMCAPTAPTTSVSSYLKEYEEKYGGFLVPSITTPWANAMIALDALAEKYTAYQDRRERLWGILLNTIYAMSLKPDQERLERLLILGGVVCRRLEGWDNYRAAPSWPPAEWENLLSTTKLTSLPSSSMRLELRVRLANNMLAYELNGGKYIQKSLGQQSLLQKPEIILEGVFNKLSSLAKKEPKSSTQADAETLADTGHNLYSEVFPEDLKREYETSFREPVGHSLLIISDEPWIPWEVVKPDTETGVEPHLCEGFYLARWFPGNAPPSTMTLNKVVVVRPPSNLRAAKSEEDYLTGLQTTSTVSSVTTLAKVEEVLRSFRAGHANWYHFVCHGNFSNTDPNESKLKLEDGYLSPGNITGDKKSGLRGARPLIFLNACHTGQLGFGLTRIGGWAKQFVEAGASAFIGTLWAVNDQLAATFAIEFYNRLLGLDGHQPMTIGRAFHDARMVIKKLAPGNPTWLAYVLYGDPNARVDRQ